MKPTDDFTLITQIQRNNRHSFNELFGKYYVPLCRYANKICENEANAEDAVQMVFIRLWENRNSLQIKHSVISYLFTAVRLKVFENYRSGQIAEKHAAFFAENIETTESVQFPELDNYALATLIWDAVDQLPEKCAEIFRLSRDEGLTYNEIAQHLGISVKTVEHQMGIAFKKLREILYPKLKARGWDHYSTILFLSVFLGSSGICGVVR